MFRCSDTKVVNFVTFLLKIVSFISRLTLFLLYLYSVFKVHPTFKPVVEITRFELVTPCLQGRCSPS